MPTYEYHCDACEHDFEDFHSIMDKPLKKCPACGKLKLRRLFGTGAAIVFKGSGFYQTDYRSDSYKKAAEKDKPASESKGESKSDGKSEPKSETKSESKSESKPASDSKSSSGDRKSKG